MYGSFHTKSTRAPFMTLSDFAKIKTTGASTSVMNIPEVSGLNSRGYSCYESPSEGTLTVLNSACLCTPNFEGPYL